MGIEMFGGHEPLITGTYEMLNFSTADTILSRAKNFNNGTSQESARNLISDIEDTRNALKALRDSNEFKGEQLGDLLKKIDELDSALDTVKIKLN